MGEKELLSVLICGAENRNIMDFGIYNYIKTKKKTVLAKNKNKTKDCSVEFNFFRIYFPLFSPSHKNISLQVMGAKFSSKLCARHEFVNACTCRF